MSGGGGHSPRFAIALAGLCLAVLSTAFAVHPVRASFPIFWSLVGLAAVAGVAAVVELVRYFPGRPESRSRLLRDEFRRLADAIDAIWSEQQTKRPRSNPFVGNGDARHAKWTNDTRGVYSELQPWALRVFDEAVSWQVLSRTSRPLLENPQATHLFKVLDLFREAAEALERA